MAVRVKKLARELNQSPRHVLGVLHAIGFDRYRSPEDMLPDGTVDKVRRATRDGVEPVPVPGLASAPTKTAPRASTGDDVMAKLVPGVVRTLNREETPLPPVAPLRP